MPNPSSNATLAKYLDEKLAGSTLRIIPESNEKIEVQAGNDITLRIIVDMEEQILRFSLFSPKLDRNVTFEEIAGSTLLDVRLDDELKSTNHEAEEADITLAIDLLEIWAEENKYTVRHSV